MLPPDPQAERRARRRCRPPRRADPGRRPDIDPAPTARRRTRRPRRGRRATLESRSHGARSSATPAAGHLPRMQSSTSRAAGRSSSTCPTTSATTTTALAGPFDGADHDVRLAEARSPRASRGRSTTATKSHHHQGDRRGRRRARGDRLEHARRAARGDRGARRRYALGVQWHPEADPTSRLIAALVEAAQVERVSARSGAVSRRQRSRRRGLDGREAVATASAGPRHDRGAGLGRSRAAVAAPRDVHGVLPGSTSSCGVTSNPA